MSAPTTSRPRTKPCELETCTELIVERPRAARAEFDGRRFHSRACSTVIRVAAAAEKKRAETAARRVGEAVAAAPPYKPRLVEGTWRPNAPGWPAVPSGTSQVTR